MKIDLSDKKVDDKIFHVIYGYADIDEIQASNDEFNIKAKIDTKYYPVAHAVCFNDGTDKDGSNSVQVCFNSAQECAEYFVWIAKQEKLVTADEAIKAFRDGKRIKKDYWGENIPYISRELCLETDGEVEYLECLENLLVDISDRKDWEILE